MPPVAGNRSRSDRRKVAATNERSTRFSARGEKRDPFPASPLFLDLKRISVESARDRFGLLVQNAGSDKVTVGAEGITESRQRSDQQFAEEIGRDDFVACGWLPSQQIRSNEAGPRNAVESRVLARVRDRLGIVVESQNFSGAETPRSERENPCASSRVKHSPGEWAIPRNLFQQAK